MESDRRDTSNVNLYLATFAVNLAGTSAGCALTWTSPTLPKLYQPNDKLTITVEQGAWIGSLLSLGAAFGPLVATLIVDRIGRKCSIILCTFLFFVHWTMIALFNSLEAIYLARFIAGMALGGVFSMIPAYIAEIATLETRGVMGSMITFFVSAGCCLSYIVGPYTSILTTVVVCATIPLISILLFVWVPKSPYYLMGKGRRDQAYKALQWLRRCADEETIEKELFIIQNMLKKSNLENHQSRSSLLQIFQSRNLKCLYYACTLMFFQQMIGANAIIFYSQSIFEQSSSTFSPSISAIFCGFIMLCASFLAPIAGKLFRIKNILYGTVCSCFFCMTLLSIYFHFQENENVKMYFNWIPIASVVGFISSYLIGIATYSFVIIAEIFHPNVKSLGSAITTTITWLTSFIVTRFFSSMLQHIGASGTFGLFAGVCLLAFVFLVFQLPDTQGKSFQEIQDMIAGGKSDLADEVK